MYTNDRYANDKAIEQMIVDNLAKFPGFVRLADHPKHAISEMGEILGLTSGKILNPGIGSSGYKQMPMYTLPDMRAKTQRLHQLVAKEFVSNDSPGEKTVVNHINGDKLDNRAENLEWTTHSKNMRHAITSGLVGSSTSLILFDMKNRLGYRAQSAVSADAHMGFPFSTTQRLLKSKNNRCVHKGWIITLATGSGYIKDELGNLIRHEHFPNIDHQDTVVAYDIHTKTVHLFDCTNAAALATNTAPTTVINSCCSVGRWPTRGYLFNWGRDAQAGLVKYRDYVPEELAAFTREVNNIQAPILLEDAVTSEKMVFCSRTSLTERFPNLTKHFAQKHIAEGTLVEGKYRISYLEP